MKNRSNLFDNYLPAAFFLFGTLALHWPARNAGFMSDFLGWQALYNAGSWRDIFSTFGYAGHQQVLQAINYAMYKAFGTQGLPWYLLFGFMHALNGFLLYRLVLKMNVLWQIEPSRWIAFFAASFFLFSPYHPEATVWRVCLHYMISGACTLGALLATIRYLTQQKTSALWVAHGLMLVNLFTLELALAIPLLTHALVIGFAVAARSNDSLPSPNWGRVVRDMTLPQAGLYFFYFVFNKFTLGQWVGHYGEDRMLKINLLQMFANPLKYLVKHIGLVRHYEHPIKMKIFDFLSEPSGVILGYGLLAAMVAGAIFAGKRLGARWIAVTLFAGMALLAAVPVANLHLEWMLYNENDRYGYLPALFSMTALALAFSWLPDWKKWAAAAGFVLLSCWLMLKTTIWWGEMESMYRKLLDDFKWYDKKEVYILSLADNYRGIWMFRIYSKEAALPDALSLVKNTRPQGNFHEIAFFNMNSTRDGITASVPDSTGMIKVEFDQWGNWWWLAGLGANDYSVAKDTLTGAPGYDVTFKGKWYELKFKEKPDSNAVFIYQSGDHWKVIGEWLNG